jgi:hypothetical protein
MHVHFRCRHGYGSTVEIAVYHRLVVEKATAAEIRRQWADAGSPHCDHVKTEWEYDTGQATGRRVCLRCGSLRTSGGRQPARSDADHAGSQD